MPLNAVGRLDQLLIAGGETRAAKARAGRTEGRAGNNCDFFRLKQSQRKFTLAASGYGNIRERVKRSARQMTPWRQRP